MDFEVKTHSVKEVEKHFENGDYDWQFNLYKEIVGQNLKEVSYNGKTYKVKNKQAVFEEYRNRFGTDGPLLFEISELNHKGLPKYHIEDGNNPRIIDIYTAYPKQIYGDLKLVYENGYVWICSSKKGKLFMDMHGWSNNLEDIYKTLNNLIIKRDTPCTIFDELD